MNSYQGSKLYPNKQSLYKIRIQINEAIKWYREDAALIEQQWGSSSVIKNRAHLFGRNRSSWRKRMVIMKSNKRVRFQKQYAVHCRKPPLFSIFAMPLSMYYIFLLLYIFYGILFSFD